MLVTQKFLFDASRLLSRTERTAPTGVDRVCLAYAEWLLSLDEESTEIIAVRSKHDQLVVVDDQWFRHCVSELRKKWDDGIVTSNSKNGSAIFAALSADQINSSSVLDAAPNAVVEKKNRKIRVWNQFLRSKRMPRLPSGSLYFNIGHTSLNNSDILQQLEKNNIGRIIFLHDLIPITHPEFCRPGDGPKHQRRVEIALRWASNIIVNSIYTREQLIAFAKMHDIPCPPIHSIHLGLETAFLDRSTLLPGRPYFVHVGTIEARKNLAFLLTVWRRLHERMGPTTPQLVLIGRHGWENEAVIDHLERSPNLQGLVHQAADLPDATLRRLMIGAQAIVAPSSVEGFDLPAVEASALGVPLIASDIPAHRELVPNAELIDPLDGLGWLAALERATLRKPTSPPYHAPTWPEHFAQLAGHLDLGSGRGPKLG